MYIAKTGQISKAAVYMTLSPVFSITLGLMKGEYQAWIIAHILFVVIGYSLIQYKKNVILKRSKKVTVKVKFFKQVHEEYEVYGQAHQDLVSEVDHDYDSGKKICLEDEDSLYDRASFISPSGYEVFKKKRDKSIAINISFEDGEESLEREFNSFTTLDKDLNRSIN